MIFIGKKPATNLRREKKCCKEQSMVRRVFTLPNALAIPIGVFFLHGVVGVALIFSKDLFIDIQFKAHGACACNPFASRSNFQVHYKKGGRLGIISSHQFSETTDDVYSLDTIVAILAS